MTTTSYPAYGTSGFGIDKWQTYFDSWSGIINDLTGTSLALTRVNTGNIARYSPGQIRVAGYVLEVTANHDLTVSTTAGTYYTWACYDPALNVADGSGNATAAGPCTLDISSGLPSTSGGKKYVLIDKIIRTTGQALTAATVNRLAPWVGPSLTIPAMPPGLTVDDLQWTTALMGNDIYPLGSTLTVLSGTAAPAERFHRTVNGSSVYWQSESVQDPTNLSLRSGLVAFDTAPKYYTSGGLVHLRGTAKRSSGAKLNTGSDVIIADMPAELCPASIRRRVCDAATTSGLHAQVSVKIGSTGEVAMYDTGTTNISWIDLSGISYAIWGG